MQMRPQWVTRTAFSWKGYSGSGGGFFESIDMIAASLGFDLDADRRTHHEVAVATQPIESPIGPIETGCVAA